MNKLIDINEERAVEEAKANPGWTPRVITGGKGPPMDPGDPNDWLSRLPQHTTFLAQNKKDINAFALGQFSVVYKGDRAILLILAENKQPVWVDPARFCRDFRQFEIVQSAEEYELELKANKQLGVEIPINKVPEQINPEEIGL